MQKLISQILQLNVYRYYNWIYKMAVPYRWITIGNYPEHQFFFIYTEKTVFLDQQKYCLPQKKDFVVICATKLLFWASKSFLLGFFVSITKLFSWCNKNVLLVQQNCFVEAKKFFYQPSKSFVGWPKFVG